MHASKLWKMSLLRHLTLFPGVVQHHLDSSLCPVVQFLISLLKMGIQEKKKSLNHRACGWSVAILTDR